MENILANMENENNNPQENKPEDTKEINDQAKSNINLSVKSLIRLREVYVINNLKKQISSMKNSLKKKDEEIEEFKNSVKCAKYSKLEFNYNTNLTSFAKTKKDNDNVRKLCSELTEKYLREREESEKIGNLYFKQKTHLDDMKQKFKTLEEENQMLIDKCKSIEERNTFLNNYSVPPASSHATRMTTRKQDKLLENYKDELENLSENFKREKIKLEKRIFYMDKDYKELKKCYEYFK